MPIVALISAWLVLGGVGVSILARADVLPDGASHVTEWPAGSRLTLSRARPTLLVFVHPQCPCSTATIAELERLVAHAGGRLDVAVVAFVPEDDPPAWHSTRLVETARSIPNVHVVFDVGGKEAKLFGAMTSGQALLFEPGGAVIFRGGLTASRGHEGDNDGRSAIEAIASGKAPLLRDVPVFGCQFAEPALENVR